MPTIAEAMAHTNTAAAPRSLISFILLFLSVLTKSAIRSRDEFMISAEMTIPMQITTAIHSSEEIRKTNPATTTQIAAVA